ncbi:uncharacterized protein [Amphiura filiformis]|uniref:uncharacterized protein isoform X2 n=1 Tax=Amphiura filiformis TaxID=82378 RepID=UPI003B227D6B
MMAESGEDWVLVLSDDEADKEMEQETSSAAETSDNTLNTGAENTKESQPGTSAEADSKEKTSIIDADVDKSIDHPGLSQEQKSDDDDETGGGNDVKPDASEDAREKSTDGNFNEQNNGQNKLISDKGFDRGDEDDSCDSDQTIVMDAADIEKAVDKVDSEVKEGADRNLETGKTVSADSKSNQESVDADNQGQQSQQEQQQIGGHSGDLKKTDNSEGVKCEMTSTGVLEKDEGSRETFRSLDLPIHPVHETRRSRTRQKSEEHPLERSPSVASNRSEESSGTHSSNKQRKKEEQMTETQRERRKSGASSTKGGKMVRPGFEFRPGFKLQAQDFSDKWYPAKIVQVDEEDSTVLIHFDGWNSRFDEWMDYKSNRLRPAPRRETSPEKVFIVGDTVLARWSDTRYYQGKIRGVNSNGSYRVRFYDGLEKSVQAGNIREMPEELRPIVSPQGYGIGDEVLARWNDCRYYPAKILSIKKNGAFRVLFYDGIEKSVQPFNVREMSADLKAQDFFKQFKAQIKASEEKNRKREKRKREEAEAATDETSSISKEPPQRLMKRRFSPPPVAKRSRHDSMDSSKTGSSIIEDKDVSCEKEVDVSHDKEDDAQEILTDEAGQESNSEYEIHKVVLKRGIGYYINNFIYIKNRESSIGLILRCQNRNHCHARAIIKKNGKAVIKQGHMHEPPLAKNIEFCSTDPDDDTSAMLNKPSHSQDLRNISTDSVESSPDANPLSSPTTEGSVTPVIQMLTAEEVEKIKERKKHIREPFAAPKELIIDLDHNKYKCEVPECGKSFRKATLLEYHKKYYHIKQATSSVTTTAASKVLSRSRKRVSTSPTTSSSRRSSEETGTPAKVTRSQRSSAPSELAIISPTREPMSPPINSPAERKKSLDGKDRKRERSGDKIPEVRVAKNPETRSPVETKAGKIPETRIPKSPETRLVRSSNGKFVKTTPECRGSRSLSAESRSSPTAEGRVRRVSAPDRTRQLSGSGVVKPPETVPEHADNEKPTETVETTGPKVGDMEGNITITKADEVVGSNNNDTNKDIGKDASKDNIKDASKDNIKDASKDTNNKDINNLDEAKSIDDVVIKQEPDDVKLPQESPKILETATPVHSSKQEIKSKMALPASTEGRKEHTEVKVEKEREGKSRSERAKVKHKKKHKHKHDKGKDERSRDRHKGDRRREVFGKDQTIRCGRSRTVISGS